MKLIQQEISIPVRPGHQDLLGHLREACAAFHLPDETPVRFVIAETGRESYAAELSTLARTEGDCAGSIFDFHPREGENQEAFNAVLLIPTGIGAALGGHAGDANPAARLLASVCDTLVTHPNVVNASDINELPENGLYVEGSLITRLLMGTIALQRVRANRVGLIIDQHTDPEIATLSINAASAARTTLGMDIPWVIQLDPPVRMRAETSSSGAAAGAVDGLEHLCAVARERRDEYDALAVASVIEVERQVHKAYLAARGAAVNPWGGVEAMLTHALSTLLDVPTAHAPMMASMAVVNEITELVDPRMAAEEISSAFLHCVLKGLHRAPRVVSDRRRWSEAGMLSHRDVSCLVQPDHCIGLPTLAALEQGIPVIAVQDEQVCMRNRLSELPFREGTLFRAANYLEAAGILSALKAGLSPASITRPLADTRLLSAKQAPAPPKTPQSGSLPSG